MVAVVSDPETRAYTDRRTKEGLSKRETIRCLKRYVALQVDRVVRMGANIPRSLSLGVTKLDPNYADTCNS